MTKLSRNDLCWCGSGKKYKKCHLERDDLLRKYELEGYKIPSRSLIKSEEQIDGIRRSGELTKRILHMLNGHICEGITTNEIDRIVYEFTIKNGGKPATLNYNGYSKSICTSINDVVCHGIPDETVLNAGDIINVDVSTILDGYYSDSSRMYSIGNISDVADKLIKTAKECLEIGIDMVKPYESLNKQGVAIEEYAAQMSFSVVQDLGGHGIGLKFHEDPHVHHFDTEENDILLLPGMVFTIEPMINEGVFLCRLLDDEWTIKTLDGGLSAQWEHTVLVTETGVEILT